MQFVAQLPGVLPREAEDIVEQLKDAGYDASHGSCAKNTTITITMSPCGLSPDDIFKAGILIGKLSSYCVLY